MHSITTTTIWYQKLMSCSSWTIIKWHVHASISIITKNAFQRRFPLPSVAKHPGRKPWNIVTADNPCKSRKIWQWWNSDFAHLRSPGEERIRSMPSPPEPIMNSQANYYVDRNKEYILTEKIEAAMIHTLLFNSQTAHVRKKRMPECLYCTGFGEERIITYIAYFRKLTLQHIPSLMLITGCIMDMTRMNSHIDHVIPVRHHYVWGLSEWSFETICDQRTVSWVLIIWPMYDATWITYKRMMKRSSTYNMPLSCWPRRRSIDLGSIILSPRRIWMARLGWSVPHGQYGINHDSRLRTSSSAVSMQS